MIKKFFSAIVIVFAFLFLNIGVNYSPVKAEELPESIKANAGIGEKMEYWAIVDYGAQYIGDDHVTIDIQQEAIANPSVNSIVIAESGFSLTDRVHYERNLSPEFASKISYELKNKRYGEKYITILLLTEFSYNPSENTIVDKIIIRVEQKRRLDDLSPDDLLIIKENEGEAVDPYGVNVTLPSQIPGKGNLEDYVFKSVKYTYQKGDESITLNALYQSLNNYYFTVDRNGYYLIEVEDIFGCKLQKMIEINNLKDPEIIIEVIPSVTTPINHAYTMDVKVRYYGNQYILNSDDLRMLEYSFNDGSRTSIITNMQILVSENGVYTIYAISKNGSEAELSVLIDNIDKENPYIDVMSIINVETEYVHLFDPAKEIFVYDNVSTVDTISISQTYYKVDDDGNKGVILSDDLAVLRSYLYSVRDVIVRYRVSDEAGNVVEVDVLVHSIDTTKPVINKTAIRKDFYINDPYPTAEEVERAYGLIVTDNSIYSGTKWTITYNLDFSKLPVDQNNRLNMLGLYDIYVSAVDEAGNVSDPISLVAEVRQRLIHIVADVGQYIIYGDIKSEDIKIGYHCLTKDGEEVTCESQLLEGDSISGELYVLNAYYVGKYEIHYDNISIPSKLYYLEYTGGEYFEIKQRTMKVVAHDKKKFYLDEDPELTWNIDTSVCDPSSENYNKDYRCTFVPDTTDYIGGYLDRYKGEPPEGINIWTPEYVTPEELQRLYPEVVWYDSDGNLVARDITIGTLRVYEQYNSGIENYALIFEGADFLIEPKNIVVKLKDAVKIYGELDPVFEIDSCMGAYPINGATVEFCNKELSVVISRVVEGETVRVNGSGQYIDYYAINGVANNLNYSVIFEEAYLTILRRDISISVKGDLDDSGNPTGKYTIYYEDELPVVEVYDSSVGASKGLVNNPVLGIVDKFSASRAEITTPDGQAITDYVNGIGIYLIKKGDITILDKDDNEAEYNYNVTFNDGILEVIKKEIWIRIIKEFTKIYGDEDKIFTSDDLAGYDDYVILEANGRFIIEIRPTTVAGEDPYIPRDNERMKYHLKREEGIHVGKYPIRIEDLEGCENYDVYLLENYLYEITTRDLVVSINNQIIVYKEIPEPFTFREGELIDGEWVSSIQYQDYVTGNVDFGEFKDVGVYRLGIDNLVVLDKDGGDVTFCYNIRQNGGELKIVQREVTIAVREGQSKMYGNEDPTIEFMVFYQGIEETILEYDYSGGLGRAEGEVPDKYYEINWGTFKLNLNGEDEFGTPVANYLITEFQNNHKFFIEKRTINIKARDVTAIYGNDYSESIIRDTNGGLAYNLTLKIDGYGIHDEIVGELKILGEVNGVGTYTISCEDLRIVRHYNREDVTEKYYNFNCEDGILTILPRTIKINPDDGQFKTYGDDDTGITFTYEPNLLDPGDVFEGELKRVPRLVNGKNVTEEVGEYSIGLGTLNVKTPSGKENYVLTLDGSKTFTINYRKLTVQANSVEIFYGDDFNLTWSIIDGSLANNSRLGIVDTIAGELNLDKEYNGYGIYNILGDDLVVSNVSNYNYSFIPGLLIVNKKVITVTPSEETLYKVYGENNPEEFKFTLDVSGVAYTGKLGRQEGENAGRYRILVGTLDFGPNYDVILKEAYFTIMARVIEVKAENTGKLYGTKDPELKWNYVGTLIGDDTFYGSLIRDVGEEVGDYDILQGSLSLSSNYTIRYTPGIFSIRYAPFTSITIYSLTNNQYQVKGEEEEVRLYVRFNEGADETHIGDVNWKIVKNGDMDWEYTKDTVNNVISFFPNGSIGTYVVSATYQGITGYYEVYVELSTVGNVYIRLVNGEVNQILGKESRLTYMVIVPETASSDATVQWLINGATVKSNKVSNIYFDYTPNLGKGEYTVQAKIGSKTSDPLYFYVKNNNPPVITLNGDPVVYIEARTGTKYIEEGAVVIDDIDGDITSSLVITGTVNEEIKGTYYIKYDAKDRHGNNAITVYRQVVVRDTTPPVVTLIGNKEVVLLYGQTYNDPGATAYDNYDGVVEAVPYNPIVVDKVGKYEIIYVAYDKSGNRGTATRYVSVIDNISPKITLIGDEITYVEVYEEFEDEGALIEDNVDGTFIMPATSFYFGTERVDGVDTSRLGTYYVHYDYTDTAGNVGAGQVRIVIVRDSTPPVIVLNGENPYIIRYSYPDLNFQDPGAVAYDNYDSYVPVVKSGELGNELGRYYIYYDAVDSHGNIAQTVTREVIVIDVENPIIHFHDKCPQYITIEALYEEYDTRCDAPGWGVWVEDDYMADLEELQKRVVVTGTVDSTTVGLYIIKYDVKDMAGNSAVTLHRYVNVVDTIKPVITLKCEGGNSCGSDSSQTVEVFTTFEDWGATVYDRYDMYHGKEIKITKSHNVNVMKLGEYEIVYNATDSNGNKAEPVVRKVYVKDTTPPVVTIIGENPLYLERGIKYTEYEVTVIDNYDGPISFDRVTITNAPSGMSRGVYDVVYRVADSSGNIGEAKRRVIVDDTIPPIVLGVENGKYYKEPVSIHFIPTLGTDEVLTGWLNGKEIQSPHYVEDEGIYELLVVDDAGNKTEIWFAIDTTPPEILGVKNGEYTNREVVEVYSNEKIKYYEYRYNTGEWVRTEEQTVKFDKEGTYRIYAVDMADNVSGVTMFVVDRTPPNYSLTGAINKGVTNTDVRLITEENAIVAVNNSYNIPTLYNFIEDGYYNVTIRDLAGNTVALQFVINKAKQVMVDGKLISIISQHNAIDKVSITGNGYARNNGVMIVMPLVDGGFKYVSGKLFSETEYQTLLSGGTIEIKVAGSDDTYMFVGFVVTSEELNKFGSQTVEGDDDDEGVLAYGIAAIVVIGIMLLFFVFFLKRRKKQEEEEEVEEIIYDDTE